MGNLLYKEKEPPPPIVLVPPLFDFPPLEARTRMTESAYDYLFAKLARRTLFEEYFEKARQLSTRILLKPIDDPNVDLVATISGGLNPKRGENVLGHATFRWQRDKDEPHNFVDIFMSNSDQILRLRSCMYEPTYGVGMFTILPLLQRESRNTFDHSEIGLRYGSEHLSVGSKFLPLSSTLWPSCAWVVGRVGRLTAGVQFEPFVGFKSDQLKNLLNWSFAISYGGGLISPLTPSFNFGLELSRGSQLIMSFYQHAVVQRRVKNVFEADDVVGITNYIDFGLELETSIPGVEASENSSSSFKIAASWQANKNVLVKGKLGPLSSCITLAFKSWWKPAFTFSVSAVRDRTERSTSLGFGLRIEDLREASYQRADPNYVMLTPTKGHVAEGVLKSIGKRQMLRSNMEPGNFDGLPKDMRPVDIIL